MKPETSLFVSNNFAGKSGSSIGAVNFLMSLMKTVENVEVLTPVKYKIPSFYLHEYNLRSLQFIRTGYAIRGDPCLKNLTPKYMLKWCKNHSRNFLVSQRIKHKYYDNVVINSFSGHYLYELFNTKKYRESYFILHGSPDAFRLGRLGHLTPSQLADILNSYNNIISVSQNILDDWYSVGLNSDVNVYVVGNCCLEKGIKRNLAQTKTEVKSKLGIVNTAFIISVVGRICHGKGQDLIMQYAENILSAIPEAVIFFIGNIDDKEYYDSLLNINGVRQFVENGNIQFLQFRKNVHDYIYASDLLILPSRGEALPLSILEAMALKTPVLASNVGGNTELIKEDHTGYIFEITNSDQMYRQITHIYRNYDEAVHCAENAYRDYWKYFSQTAQFSKFKAIIDNTKKAGCPPDC